MLRFNLDRCGIADEELRKAASAARGYGRMLQTHAADEAYAAPESFLYLPEDERMLRDIRARVSEKGEKVKLILLVGIGGSNLGARAVYEAVRLKTAARNHPRVVFLDAVQPASLTEADEAITELSGPEELVAVMVSKSGATMETAANGELVLAMIERRFKGSSLGRLVVVTDKDSTLAKDAERLGMPADRQGVAVTTIPGQVGGRFSVFSAAGLLPLALAGIDIGELCAGALEIRESCLSENIDENPALRVAALLFSSARRDRTIHDLFLEEPKLEWLGKWHRALLAESIGKEGVGITPTVSLGTADLHSTWQLVNDGPRDKVLEIVRVEKREEGPRIGTNLIFPSCPGTLQNKSVRAVSGALIEGMLRALRGKDVPFFEVSLPDASERSLGAFMMYKMTAVAWLGRLFSINAFDQPAVEQYKNHAREALNNNQ